MALYKFLDDRKPLWQKPYPSGTLASPGRKKLNGTRWHIASLAARPIWKRILQTRSLIVIFMVLLLSSFLWQSNPTRLIQWPEHHIHIPFAPPVNNGSGPYFHFLLPATSSNSRLCKVLLSSLTHNYPAPTIINWGLKAEDLDGYDPTTGKMWGVLKYLRNLDSTHDSDMVLMVDGHDVWFQLRPEVLMQRYHAVNEAANHRLEKMFGADLLREHDIRQTIIFGAEKYCWPHPHNTPHCYAVPESPLPPDVNGPNTDHGFKNNRPRWLNSGTIMGPVGDMRKLFERVHQMWLDEPNNSGADQYYLGGLFGLQEFYRHKARNSSEWIHTFEWFEPEELEIPKSPLDHQTEFHIGLDYGSTMFQTLNVAGADLGFVRHNGQDNIYEMQDKLGIIPNRKFGLPADIASSRPPMLPPTSNDGIAKDATASSVTDSRIMREEWGDVPLCTNFRSEAIPVSLHHNCDKSTLDSMWGKMWFLPHAKDTMRRNTLAHNGPIVLGDRTLHGGAWWSMRDGKAGGWSASDAWLSWEDLCSEYEEEICAR